MNRYRENLEELVTERAAELTKANEQLRKEISERKRSQEMLARSESELRRQKLALEQKNIALREILAQIEIEKKSIRDNIEANLDAVKSPILEKLKEEVSYVKLVNLLHRYLKRLTSPYGVKITGKKLKLTPREIEVCNMVKGGLKSKDISSI